MLPKFNYKPYCLPHNPPIQKSIFVLHIFTFLVSRDTFVPTKIVQKVDFLERDFERDHLAEKATGQKWAKITLWNGIFTTLFFFL
jgi:hypothetical protein